MTLHMYARRKGWPLKEVKAHLNHTKSSLHHEDIAKPGEPDSNIDRFERIIELVGDLDDEQKTRLMQIADKCPIHRTLGSPQLFATKLVGAEEWTLKQGG